jgi:hypothetical protein
MPETIAEHARRLASQVTTKGGDYFNGGDYSERAATTRTAGETRRAGETQTAEKNQRADCRNEPLIRRATER